MHPDDIKKIIESKLPDSKVTVTGDGRHFEAVVISPIFEGMKLLARQRQVMDLVNEEIRNGSIHALSIKTKTPHEWELEKNNG